MILRAFKMVHYRGLPEVVARDLPERGLATVALPDTCAAEVIAAAIGFAFGAEPEADVVDAEQGFAYVELGLSLPSGAQVSLFRGIDRRGVIQASLREEQGQRVTGGVNEVAARLSALLGEDVIDWARGVVVNADAEPDASAAARLVDPDATESNAARAQSIDVDQGSAATADARAAIVEVERALRLERLELLAERHHAELLTHGAHLRRERVEVDRIVDRENAERDRVRTRLRRVNEFRDQVARAEATAPEADAAPVAPPPQHRTRVQRALVACSAVLLTMLVLYATSVTGDPDRTLVSVSLGLALVVSVSSYVVVASDGRSRADGLAMDAAPVATRTWRDALRHRFADLNDPDDPATPRRLRERLAALDERLAPLHAQLEAIDDAVTIFDVETGRAARALHLSLPEPELADVGLPGGMDARAATRRVHVLGDAVYATTVERDALLAGGAVQRADARQALADALATLAGEDGARVDGILESIDAFSVRNDEDAYEDERESALVERLHRALEAVERASSAPIQADPAAREPSDERAPRFAVLATLPVGADAASVTSAVQAADPTIVQLIVGVPSGGSGDRMVLPRRRRGAARPE